MFLKYEGLTSAGEKISGSFWGTKEELVENLKHNDVFLTRIEEDRKKLKKGRYNIRQFAGDIEQISYMVSSGMRVDKSLQTLIKNTSRQSVIDFWQDVLNGLRAGKQFSISLKDASKEHKLTISDLYINIIGVGEEVGDLKSALNKVLSHLQFQNRLLNDVKSALAYPAFLVLVSIAAIFFIFYVILPRFSSIFSPSDFDKLPLLSQIIIGIGNSVNRHSELVIAGLVSVIFGFAVLFYTADMKKILTSLLYRLPVFKDLYFGLELSNLCSSLGVMIDGGVDISKAIRLSEDAVNIKNLKNLLKETRSELKKGTKISAVWERYSIMPEDVVSLVTVGENSASLGDVFTSLGNRYSDTFRLNVAKLLSLLEPVVIIFLGLFVGVVVVAIMLAVVSLNNVAV